ncbi:unnamed protein product [Bursaphelenchus okinawaensis]|uniref:Uncharacterized protein n=1 Tax=Bursaphelenchus okinawaensis TaxID=465554 RepID=A0A811L9B9_9BILA|nr:unnamed protein product [Bursaphelenchus okinawaensis]CAG9119799.1 unnamed protein product [Bursaphelenchus okinawaensis]
MGCVPSIQYNKSEDTMICKDLPKLTFLPQPSCIFLDLETDNDMKGQVAIDHIFLNTRDVYGQPSADLQVQQHIDWEGQYNIVFEGRPSPYDFPAFADDKDKQKKKRPSG